MHPQNAPEQTLPAAGQGSADAPCSHPPHAVTWDFKYPHDGTVAIVDGMLHGACDLCGTQVVTEVTP